MTVQELLEEQFNIAGTWYDSIIIYTKKQDWWKGKIYRCPRAALINILNKKYNTQFINSDYIDVNSSDINILKTFNSYVKWMIEPNKLCEYCIVGTRDYVQWSTDNAEYSDFIVDTYENYSKER